MKSLNELARELASNPDQLDAFNSTRHCVVLAGPGSGKTKVLTSKIARVVNEELKKPHKVACITYSSECVRELKSRLSRIDSRLQRQIYVSTVHGFALNQVIRPLANVVGIQLASPIRVASPSVQDQFFRAAHKLVVGPNVYPDRARMDRFRRLYPTTPERQVVDDDEILAITEHYERALSQAGLLDFDDIVSIATQMITNHSPVRNVVSAKFPFLFVDEYQDLPPALDRLVAALCFSSSSRLFAVGDPDQSIYGFTGAKPENLIALSSRRDVHKVVLKTNYRCGKKILDGSLKILAQSRPYLSANPDGGSIFYYASEEGLHSQCETICNTIVPGLVSAGFSLKNVAILYIDRNDESFIRQALSQHKIAFTGGSDSVFYRRSPATRWLEDCAHWCVTPLSRADITVSNLLEYVSSIARVNTAASLNETRRALIETLWPFRSHLTPLREWSVALSSFISEKLSERPEHFDDLESVDQFNRAAQDPNVFGAFTLDQFVRRGDAITIATMHASKGSEFDAVVIPGLEQGRMPRYDASATGIDAARRQFYVSITRAKREIHLLSSGWYKNTRGTVFNNGHSEFLYELHAEGLLVEPPVR